ncbi:MAG: type 1 glutamine amidotransferase [Candidatus Latescibacteria bacterium]|nr:type 1 glutamine amidotransferase [Candidatus Latescibacterota bacterium]
MSRPESELKILLIQIRRHSRVRREEHESFASFSGLKRSQIDILNVFDTPRFKSDVLNGYDAVLVGGASEASVLEPNENPFLDSGMDLMRFCARTSVPVFASCFGFQLAAQAFGRQVIRDEHDFERGSIPISLSDDAGMDPLFHDTPDPFLAVSVHRERVLDPPDGCTGLAYTSNCCHAFRIPDRPFWAFQFHPEVNRDTLIERLTIYKREYTTSDDHLEEVLAAVRETPESNLLIRKFVDRVLLDPS